MPGTHLRAATVRSGEWLGYTRPRARTRTHTNTHTRTYRYKTHCTTHTHSSTIKHVNTFTLAIHTAHFSALLQSPNANTSSSLDIPARAHTHTQAHTHAHLLSQYKEVSELCQSVYREYDPDFDAMSLDEAYLVCTRMLSTPRRCSGVLACSFL